MPPVAVAVAVVAAGAVAEAVADLLLLPLSAFDADDVDADVLDVDVEDDDDDAGHPSSRTGVVLLRGTFAAFLPAPAPVPVPAAAAAVEGSAGTDFRFFLIPVLASVLVPLAAPESSSPVPIRECV